MRPEQEPTVEHFTEGPHKGGYKETHPSYGMVRVSHITGGHPNLFGSSISHQNALNIVICRGERYRDLSTDWYHPREQLISIKLSPTQFCELITNPNCSGVPCTIEHIDGEVVPHCPERHRRQEVESELKTKLAKVAALTDAVDDKFTALLSAKSVKKSDIRELVDDLRTATQELRSNIPFAHSCFNEACDETVKEAKGEIEAAFTHIINKLGVEALRDKVHEFLGMDEAPALTAIESNEQREDQGVRESGE